MLGWQEDAPGRDRGGTSVDEAVRWSGDRGAPRTASRPSASAGAAAGELRAGGADRLPMSATGERLSGGGGLREAGDGGGEGPGRGRRGGGGGSQGGWRAGGGGGEGAGGGRRGGGGRRRGTGGGGRQGCSVSAWGGGSWRGGVESPTSAAAVGVPAEAPIQYQ